MKWVNVYHVTREYGGPEEGGWYYNVYDCVEAVKTPEPEKVKEELEEKHKDDEYGNIYSVLGGVKVKVFIEDEMAESQGPEGSTVYCLIPLGF
ncbi:hypothetical protein, partial [Mycobacterium tuberculosis]|uniref:hypothetical protein n=1 Tax=Mycobacterium tuberculosis TaxID=1773 RepID=UPI001BE091A7